MTQHETKNKILDVAEKLFAEAGYKATSLRAITSMAGVNLAAVNYHFGSKEGLISAVIERRLVPLNKSRLEQLHRVLVEAADQSLQANVVIRAFVEPTLMFTETLPSGKNFLTLVGRALAEPDETVRKIFIHNMQEVMTVMREALGRSLPDLPSDVLFWRLNFLIGALSHTMRCIEKCPMALEGGVARDAASLAALIVPFLTAGMEAPHA
ncbi:MAG: TetR family transcriptional regulator [Proteobacteria bacterium]|nr:TetR family transcriptional regulator [Pseudomonadota bacterium]MBU1687592.1 TetR family transcriptional regulator [Pseudomonadota bacterium]